MSKHTYVCADTHFGHKGIITFTKPDGTPIRLSRHNRPFATIEEHDEALIENWNNTVEDQDTVYILGDFCINRRALDTASRLNGDLVLIKGNHDVFKLEEYSKYFRDIRAYHVLPAHGAILSHIPVHPDQLTPNGRWRKNIHGHLHSAVVTENVITAIVQDSVVLNQQPDKRYTCVSMEHIDFTPILLDKVLS